MEPKWKKTWKTASWTPKMQKSEKKIKEANEMAENSTRRTQKNSPTLAVGGVDTAENEPLGIWGLRT